MVFTRNLYKKLGEVVENRLQEVKRTRKPKMSKKDDQEGDTQVEEFPKTTDEKVAMLEVQMSSIQASLELCELIKSNTPKKKSRKQDKPKSWASEAVEDELADLEEEDDSDDLVNPMVPKQTRCKI